YSGREFRFLLEDPEVGAPELVVVHGAQLRPGDEGRRAGVGETGEVGDHELRTRLVGRNGEVRVGQHERVGEVRVRTVDQRHVPAGDEGVKRVQEVQDPHGLGRHATGLQRHAFVVERGGGHAQAQAGVHAEGRVLVLEGRVFGEAGRAAAVVQVDRGGDQAGREEVGHGALERHGKVFGRVEVRGTEQDDRLADLLALAQYVNHEVGRLVGAELVAEDVDAGVPARRRGRAG